MQTVYDFGSKIGGARKDQARAMAEAERRAGIVSTVKRTRRPPRYGVYGGGGKVYAARITTGRRQPVPLEFFPDYAAARAWLNAQPREALEEMHRAALAAQAITDEHCRRPVNKPRTGPDYRNGLPVAPHEFMRTFQPFGVEFGNWQDNRQAMLDQAYDALRDLAGAVGLPTVEIGFAGKLGLAFGARGHGKAAAHYEPDRCAINLTKTQGAGCLAHEWFHAYDHQTSGGRPTGGPYAYTQTDGLRSLSRTLSRLDMYRRSRAADGRRCKPYWSTNHEMAARAFEAWIRAKVDNDYLANIRTPAEFERAGSCYPYPLADEMPAIDAEFRKLFGV